MAKRAKVQHYRRDARAKPRRAPAVRVLFGLLPVCLASALTGGCSISPPPAARNLVGFQVTELTQPALPLPASSGGVIDVPAVFRINVRVMPETAAIRRLHVSTWAYVPECNGRPIPKEYRTKSIVFADVNPDAAVQDWRFSNYTLNWLDLCNDLDWPQYPSLVPLAGRLTLRAMAEDSSGAVSRQTLTIVVGQGLAARPAAGAEGAPIRVSALAPYRP